MAVKKTVKKVNEKSTTAKPSRAVSARRTTSNKVTTPTSTVVEREERVTTENKSPKVKKSYVIGVLALLLLIALLYAGRSLFVAAMVNGQPVSRLALVQELEKSNGKQALNSLVTKTLILQEARKQNVNVSDDEVNQELKKIETNLSAQGQKLDQVLTLQGMTKDSLIEQIKIQKLIEKMVGKDIKVSDKEITTYIADNKDSFPAGTNEAQIKTQVKEQLRQQKLNEKVQAWIDKLQKNASINYFVKF